jgi:hypothetical protein
MTKAEINTPNVKYKLYPLTRLAELMGYDRSLFRQEMLKGQEITNDQVDEMKSEMDKISGMTL